jgi:hypothetical protein
VSDYLVQQVVLGLRLDPAYQAVQNLGKKFAWSLGNAPCKGSENVYSGHGILLGMNRSLSTDLYLHLAMYAQGNGMKQVFDTSLLIDECYFGYRDWSKERAMLILAVSKGANVRYA